MERVKNMTPGKERKIYDMVYMAMFTVMIAICSWISIPTTIPFSLQTFGIFLAVAVLGGRRGSLAVLIYILLGCVGIPVFSGFAGGIGYLMGNTGGYIVGFLAAALMMWALECVCGRKTWALALQMTVGQLVCYAFGTVWFMSVYGRNTGMIGLKSVLGMCVFPFIVPDLLKMLLALAVSGRIKKVLDKNY